MKRSNEMNEFMSNHGIKSTNIASASWMPSLPIYLCVAVVCYHHPEKLLKITIIVSFIYLSDAIDKTRKQSKDKHNDENHILYFAFGCFRHKP